MKALKSKSRFVSLADLKSSIVEEIGPLEMDVVGYMKPGHGSKVNYKNWTMTMILRRCTCYISINVKYFFGATKINLNRLAVNVAPVMRVVVALHQQRCYCQEHQGCGYNCQGSARHSWQFVQC